MGNKRCPHCKKRQLSWDSDADAVDIGYFVPGIVSYYHCKNCQTEIEIFVPSEKEEE